MDFMTTLDVLIGLVTVYLVFALGVTALNEATAALLSSRGRWLQRGIHSLLSEDPNSLNTDLAAKVMDSPYVTYLGTTGVFNTWRPSYLPAWTLLQGLLDSAGKVSEDTFAKVATIKTAAEALPANSPARKIVLDLCARADHDINTFRTLLEAWFNTFEDQVTAWYKQKTHLVVGALSLVLACAMNIDTVSIVHQLSTDTKLRAAMVEKGLDLAKQTSLDKVIDTTARDKAKEALDKALNARSTADEALKKKPEDEKLKATAEAESKKVEEAAQLLAREQTAVVKRTADLAQGLSVAGLRGGWDHGEWAKLWPTDGTPVDWRALLIKLVGLLLSTAAISLGAPFWFNTLKTLASIRSVGPSTDESAAKRAKQGAPT